MKGERFEGRAGGLLRAGFEIMHGWMSVPQHSNRLQEWHEVMKDISCGRVDDLLDASRLSSLSLIPVSDPFDATADRGSRALLPDGLGCGRVRCCGDSCLVTEVRFRS